MKKNLKNGNQQIIISINNRSTLVKPASKLKPEVGTAKHKLEVSGK